ncbi:hypothetical protein D3093_04120 [Azospirillum argentinense]|uniref:Uncharacterized protein n=1 Tax=Azospirillum argentinense TaxID=2970906 RepID=A0A4D8PGS1_9PROT|nr:hypothetical protein D3093_04120 [Azospirillum argentinense]
MDPATLSTLEGAQLLRNFVPHLTAAAVFRRLASTGRQIGRRASFRRSDHARPFTASALLWAGSAAPSFPLRRLDRRPGNANDSAIPAGGGQHGAQDPERTRGGGPDPGRRRSGRRHRRPRGGGAGGGRRLHRPRLRPGATGPRRRGGHRAGRRQRHVPVRQRAHAADQGAV